VRHFEEEICSSDPLRQEQERRSVSSLRIFFNTCGCQDVGLVVAYRTPGSVVQKIVKELIALCLLPAVDIPLGLQVKIFYNF